VSGSRGSRDRDGPLLTWQRAILAGIVAFLLLGIMAGGYVGLRNAGVGPFGSLIAAGTLDARERLLVAEFSATPGTEDLARALTQAFRIDLAQSPAVTVLEPAYARAALERMQRDPTSPVDAELAREIAVREGLRAVVAGEVLRAGSGYVLSVSLLSADDGAPLVALRESASDSTAVLGSLDRLSRRLRERIGESLRTVNAGEPLAAVTTPSLEALRRYGEAVRAIDVELDHDVGIALLQEAIAHDSAFGMAWRKLAVAYFNQNVGRERVVDAASRAYAHRDRMTPYERDHTVAFYRLNVTRDFPGTIAAYRSILRNHPDDGVAHNNIALALAWTGQVDQAIEHMERSLELDPESPARYTNLAYRYHLAGRYEEAVEILARYRSRFGETRTLLNEEMHLAASRNDLGEAARIARHLIDEHGDDPAARATGERALANIAELQGRFTERNRRVAAALMAEEQRGVVGTRLAREIDLFWVDLIVWEDTAAAEARLSRAVRDHLDEIPPVDRPYQALVEAFGTLGRPEQVREIMAAFEEAVPAEVRGDEAIRRAEWAHHLALAERRFDDAVEQLRIAAEASTCERCMAIQFAFTFDLAEQADSAIARYEQFIAMPDARRLYRDPWGLPYAHERLVRLYEDGGMMADAARHAAAFVNMWENADPALQPRVDAIRDWLQRSFSDR
jgi:eukaryotic-like serine/threonine-protein kinase